MASQFIRTEERDGVFLITLDDPRTRNALGPEMAREMVEALDRFEADPGLRVLVLTGQDPAFCSGANVRGLYERTAEAPPSAPSPSPWEVMEKRLSLRYKKPETPEMAVRHVPSRLWEVHKPTIAAVNGPAYGAGFGLALSCDIRIASERASFCEAFVRVGLIPADGSCWQLPRLIGLSNTLLLQYTGDAIDAGEAHRIGLVSRVVPHEQLLPSALDLATRLARGPTVSHSLIKYLVHKSLEIGFRESLELAGVAQDLARSTEDHREGVRAFVEKRKPLFKGR